MSNENKMWKQLLDHPGALRAGWHIARKDIRGDFVEDAALKEAVGYSINDVVAEVQRSLKMSSYEPLPIISVEVPKGSLGIRPGSILSLQDRILLFAILRLIAPPIDDKLHPGVYSYRVKTGDKKKALFKENDILDLPFLKQKTINTHIDPIDAWYALWPEFDEESLKVADEYPFLSICDISAYFENISLQLLREQLGRLLQNEPNIVNTIMTCFESWAVPTDHGFRPNRGIPQGNGISSFFGNLFLMPLDEAFREFGDEHDIKYFDIWTMFESSQRIAPLREKLSSKWIEQSDLYISIYNPQKHRSSRVKKYSMPWLMSESQRSN